LIVYICLFLLGTIINAVAQAMLKKAALKEYPNKIREYLNGLVIFSYVITTAVTVLTTFTYKGISIALGSVLGAASYIWVTIIGVVIFKEKMNAKKYIALGMIIFGVVVYALC